jgi:hypothetical protein
MPRFFSDACVFPRAPGLIRIAVCARNTPLPSLGGGKKTRRALKSSREKLVELGVGRIINVCSEAVAHADHLALYAELRIAYHHFPLNDNETDAIPEDLFPAILAIYQGHDPASGVILVHCVMGVNRSMFIAALLLWNTTPNPEAVWPLRGRDLIEWMNNENVQQRGGYGILSNTVFRNVILGQ